MSDFLDALAASKEARSAELADQAYRSLEDILLLCDQEWFDPIVLDLHRRHRSAVLDHLGRNWGLAKTINELLFGLSSVVTSRADLNDPTLLSNIATLLSILMERYTPALGSDREQACQRLEAVTQRIVADLVQLCAPQVECLIGLLRSVRDWVLGRKPANRRVIMPEFPIGNSIPVKLLRDSLAGSGITVEVPRLSLSRSDTGGSGSGARKIVAAEFGRLALAPGDAVVYIDEWSSGANFETLSDAIDRAVRGVDGVPFLPVAMLTDKSAEHQYYRRRVRSHDDLLKKVGRTGEEFRCVFPPLPSRFPRGEGMYFFWSEHDRTAGYRKMQVLGALLSSLDAAVTEVAEDQEAFTQAWVVTLERLGDKLAGAKEQGISETTMRRLDVAREIFDKSREAYAACYPELEAVDHPSNRGEISDPDKALAEVAAAICTIAEAKGAKVCIAVALAHLKRQPGIDPIDRFHNRKHVAAVRELDEPARAYHRLLMAQLQKQFAAAS